MNFSKKTMTKLLNEETRGKILDSVHLSEEKMKKLKQYARYVVDQQIVQRVAQYKDDRKSGWGFPQLNLLCCVKKDGSVEKKFFEFKQVNHFLKDKDGDSAMEVVQCILLLWLQQDNSIDDFDVEKIDKELAQIDKEIEEKKAEEKKINDVGAEIKALVEPIINGVMYEPYEAGSKRAKEEIEKVLTKMVDEKKLFKFVVSLKRNTDETILRNELFIDIGYKLKEEDEFVVLACHVDPNKMKKRVDEKEEKEKSEISSGV